MEAAVDKQGLLGTRGIQGKDRNQEVQSNQGLQETMQEAMHGELTTRQGVINYV
ncbi:hypothetical protein D3C80_2068710 [compost metagenome]